MSNETNEENGTRIEDVILKQLDELAKNEETLEGAVSDVMTGMRGMVDTPGEIVSLHKTTFSILEQLGVNKKVALGLSILIVLAVMFLLYGLPYLLR